MMNVWFDGDFELIIDGILEERRYEGYDTNPLCVIENIFELGVISYEARMGRGSIRGNLAIIGKIIGFRFRQYFCKRG